MFIVLLKTVYL